MCQQDYDSIGSWENLPLEQGVSETMRAAAYSSVDPCGPASQLACRVGSLAREGKEAGHISHTVEVKRINV